MAVGFPLLLYLLGAFGWTWIIGWTAVFHQKSTILQNNIWIFLGFAAFGPTISAFATTFIVEGPAGMKNLLKRCDYKLIPSEWYFLALFGMPVLLGFTCAMYVWFGGNPPRTTPTSFFISLLLSIPVGSLGEEFGWRGILIPALQDILDSWVLNINRAEKDNEIEINREYLLIESNEIEMPSSQWKWSPLVATFFVGVVWALWHLPSFYIDALSQNHCNFGQFVIQEILYSVFYTWMSNNTSYSILGAIIMHASINSFGGLVPWGTKSFPSFLAMPNSIQTVIMLAGKNASSNLRPKGWVL